MWWGFTCTFLCLTDCFFSRIRWISTWAEVYILVFLLNHLPSSRGKLYFPFPRDADMYFLLKPHTSLLPLFPPFAYILPLIFSFSMYLYSCFLFVHVYLPFFHIFPQMAKADISPPGRGGSNFPINTSLLVCIVRTTFKKLQVFRLEKSYTRAAAWGQQVNTFTLPTVYIGQFINFYALQRIFFINISL